MVAAMGLAGAQADSIASQPEFTDFSDLSGKTVSMLTGAPFEELVRSKVPDVGAFSSFNNMPDILLALKSGKTDAFLINNAIATLAVNRDPELALFPQNLQDGAFGFAFAKGDPRRDAWQAAFDSIPEAQIQAVIEYSEADEQATMTVRYNGAPYDVLERGDELSRAMLTGNTKDIAYDAAAVDDFTNCLTLVFTEKQ